MAQKARRDRRPPSRAAAADATPVAGLEPFSSDLSTGSGMETAAIGDVTSAMMNEAAHRAAEAVEAAADPSVTETGHVDEHPGEPTSEPIMDATFIEDQIGTRAAAVSSEEEPGEAMPVATVSPVEAIATPALVEGVGASIEAEVSALEEASGALAHDNPSPVDLPMPAPEAAEPTGETLHWELPSSGEAIGAYGAQVVEMMAANIEANSHFLTALMSATSVTDVMAVNTDHLRRQMELLTTQRRQLTTLARTIAFDAMKPFSASPTHHGRDR